MKKHFLCLFVLLSSFTLPAQVNYPRQNIELLSLIAPNVGPSPGDGRMYSGCWGWYQQSKNKEYALSGTSNGTYFIDVSSPATPTVCDFVPGRPACTWREIKTYQNYAYIVSDDPMPNRFQIVDLQYLPDSVHVVHDGTTYFERGHTIWIDRDKMYIGLTTFTAGFSPMAVFSLATPTAPVLLRELQQDAAFINEVHDMYVRNDTVYASCGWQGLYVFKFNSSTNTFTQLGNYSGYSQGTAYNHSSSMTANGKYLVFCDEVPGTLPIRTIDIQNLGNIQPLEAFKPAPGTTPHNPYVLGNDFAVVSCYQDGLLIYDISQPANTAVSGYFDTHPQGGANVGNYFNENYRGNWGAYPWLPSGIIIAQDMQNGVFILDPTKAFTNRVGIPENSQQAMGLSAYPNPAVNTLWLNATITGPLHIQLHNLLGQVVYEKVTEGPLQEQINTQHLPNGTYRISVTGNGESSYKKIIIQH